MKVLTLTQPWATLVAIGAKKIETRAWKTSHRGPLAIHAASGFPAWAAGLCDEEPFSSLLRSAGCTSASQLPRGVIVAVCDLVGCEPTENIRLRPGFSMTYEYAFGDYREGRWGWRLENVRRLPVPLPARGHLMLWDHDDPRMVEVGE